MSSTPPFEIIGLDHMVLRCVDLDAMKSCYTDVIGGTVDHVTSWEVVWSFSEQFWLAPIPVFYGLQGRLAAQG